MQAVKTCQRLRVWPTLIWALASPIKRRGGGEAAKALQPEGCRAVAGISRHGNKWKGWELWTDGAQGQGRNWEGGGVSWCSQGCYVLGITWVAGRGWGVRAWGDWTRRGNTSPEKTNHTVEEQKIKKPQWPQRRSDSEDVSCFTANNIKSDFKNRCGEILFTLVCASTPDIARSAAPVAASFTGLTNITQGLLNISLAACEQVLDLGAETPQAPLVHHIPWKYDLSHFDFSEKQQLQSSE